VLEAPGDGALRFYHVPSAPAGVGAQGKLRTDVVVLPLPVMDTAWAGTVEWGTVLVVLLGAAWVLVVAARAVWRDGVGGRGSPKGAKDD
jgi:hypothetical protein